jgi:hypothetical protein
MGHNPNGSYILDLSNRKPPLSGKLLIWGSASDEDLAITFHYGAGDDSNMSGKNVERRELTPQLRTTVTQLRIIDRRS